MSAERRLYFLSSKDHAKFTNTRSSFRNEVDESVKMKDCVLGVKSIHFQSTFLNIVAHSEPHIIICDLTENAVSALKRMTEEEKHIFRIFKRHVEGIDGKMNYYATENDIYGDFTFYGKENVYFERMIKRLNGVMIEFIFFKNRACRDQKEVIHILKKCLTKKHGFKIEAEDDFFTIDIDGKICFFDENITKLLSLERKTRVIYNALCSSFGKVLSPSDKRKLFSGEYRVMSPSPKITNKCVVNLDCLKPREVHVQCDNIQPIIHNVRSTGDAINNQTLISTSFIESRQRNVSICHIDFQEPVFHKCLKDEVISFKLKDERERPLFLDIGPPTLITVNLVREMSISSVIYVDSRKTEYFIQNTPSRFTCKLTSPIKAGGGAKIHLSSISIPERVCNLYPPYNWIRVEYKNGTEKTVYLAAAEYSMISQIIVNNNVELRKAGVSIGVNRVSRYVNFKSENQDVVKITLAPGLGVMLGFTQLLDTKYEILINASGRIIAPYKYSLNLLAPQYCFLYCDIIKPMYNGVIKSNLLKLIPLSNTGESWQSGHDYLNFTFNNIEKFECIHSDIEAVSFTLTDQDGFPLYFISKPDENLYTKIYLCLSD